MDALPLLFQEGAGFFGGRMGEFFVFEGLDGSGKSTQAKRLYEYFTSIGKNCLLTYEPSSGELGRLARAVTKGELMLEDESLALLFAADRYEHFTKKIAPVLDGGGIVICDRYYYSNIVYQGVNEHLISRILDYNQQVMKHPPGIVFYLDTPPQECLKRLNSSRKDISIYENLHHLETLDKRYHALFNRPDENIVTINGSGKSEQEVWSQILEATKQLRRPVNP